MAGLTAVERKCRPPVGVPAFYFFSHRFFFLCDIFAPLLAEANADPDPEPATRQARSDRGDDAGPAEPAVAPAPGPTPAPAPAPAPTPAVDTAVAPRQNADPGKPKKLQMKVGRRVRTTKGTIYHKGLSKQQQATFPSGCKFRFAVYGTVVSGNSKDGYEVKFDMFPVGDRTATLKSAALTIVRTDENEVEQPGEPAGDDEYEDDADGPDDIEYEEPVGQQSTTRPCPL